MMGIKSCRAGRPSRSLLQGIGGSQIMLFDGAFKTLNSKRQKAGGVQGENFFSEMVGAAGFEPATPSSQTRCATRLRHAPTVDCVDVSPIHGNGANYFSTVCR